jgi:hypothetical protein
MDWTPNYGGSMSPELERIDSEIQAAESALRAGGTKGFFEDLGTWLWMADWQLEKQLIMAEFGLFRNDLRAKIGTGHNAVSTSDAALSNPGLGATENA